MTQQNALDLAYNAIETASYLIDDLAGDGSLLSMAQINQGMDIVLALGAAEADLDRLGQAGDPTAPTYLAEYQATLSRARDALRGARGHIATYHAAELAGEVAAANAQIDEALTTLDAALV